jgi:hypothetical protein
VIEDVDLRRRAVPGQGTKFVRITGYRPLDVSFQFTSTMYSGLKTEETTTPLAAQNGASDQPVTWFFQGDFRVSAGLHRREQSTDTEPPLYGEITRDGMPRYLESAFKKVGIKFSDPYYLAEPVEVSHGHIVSRMRQYEMLPWLGFGAGPIAFLASIIVWLIIRRAD